MRRPSRVRHCCQGNGGGGGAKRLEKASGDLRESRLPEALGLGRDWEEAGAGFSISSYSLAVSFNKRSLNFN